MGGGGADAPTSDVGAKLVIGQIGAPPPKPAQILVAATFAFPPWYGLKCATP